MKKLIASIFLILLLAKTQLFAESAVLEPAKFAGYVERFNADDIEDVVNLIPNAGGLAVDSGASSAV